MPDQKSSNSNVHQSCPGFGTPGCKGIVSKDSQQCPICLKQANYSRWCSQECFKTNYPAHKLIHKPHDPFIKKKVYTGTLRASFPSNCVSIPRDLTKREVPDHIVKPDYATEVNGRSWSEEKARAQTMPDVLNEDDIDTARAVNRLAREVLDYTASFVKPGITTLELDEICHNACIERGAYPSPLGYNGYPRSICTSVNEVICHGIPDLRPLEKEDIINLDVSLYKDGFHSDVNATYAVSREDCPPEALRLMKITRECLDRAIAICKPGVAFRDIGKVIEAHASRNGYGTHRRYNGHGVGRLFHGPPTIPHYSGNKAPHFMKPGVVFTIEPMITQGDQREIHWPDNWTAVTKDGKLSAQFEETLLITENGVEVLTAAPSESEKQSEPAHATEQS